MAPLFEVLGNLGVDEVFDEVLKDTLPELLDARRQHLEATIRLDSEVRLQPIPLTFLRIFCVTGETY